MKVENIRKNSFCKVSAFCKKPYLDKSGIFRRRIFSKDYYVFEFKGKLFAQNSDIIHNEIVGFPQIPSLFIEEQEGVPGNNSELGTVIWKNIRSFQEDLNQKNLGVFFSESPISSKILMEAQIYCIMKGSSNDVKVSNFYKKFLDFTKKIPKFKELEEFQVDLINSNLREYLTNVNWNNPSH